MKINCASSLSRAFPLALPLMMAACAAPQVVPPAAPLPRPAPSPQPAPPPPAPAYKDWRDAPQTPGDWRHEAGVARFGPASGTLFAIACNRSAGTVSLIRTGTSSVSVPMTIVTSSETRPLSAEPAGKDQLAATLRAHDALLDAMAFSRGRFAVEVNGLPTLYLPAWAEVGRVVEDCRR